MVQVRGKGGDRWLPGWPYSLLVGIQWVALEVPPAKADIFTCVGVYGAPNDPEPVMRTDHRYGKRPT
jgi:hypothetical protein